MREVLQVQPHNSVKSRALEFSRILLGEGLLTSEDPLHRGQRTLMQPAFHHRRVQNQAESMTHCAMQMSEMMALTLAVVSKTLFDTEIGEATDVVERAMQAMMPLFNRTFLPWGELLNRLPLPATRRFNHAKADLERTIGHIIDEHKRSGVGDLVSMLFLAQDENGEQMSNMQVHDVQVHDVQVHDVALTIFLADHETTANALTCTWYQNPVHMQLAKR